MDFLVDGWEQRTQQKLAFAGCVAALLTFRNNSLRTGSKLRELSDKLFGYGSAALLFSGIQETCRAARGKHDSLNSAISGAITGGLVVGHYQGPQYRLLGVVTWGLACSALHFANSVLRPRYILEDYLIREGLLSPHVARMREAHQTKQDERESLSAAQQDVLLASLAIRDRELRQLNQRLARAGADAAANGSSSGSGTAGPHGGRSGSGAAAGDADLEVPDDDPGYLAWLRVSGLEAEALLQPGEQQGGGGGSSSSRNSNSSGGGSSNSNGGPGTDAVAGGRAGREGAGVARGADASGSEAGAGGAAEPAAGAPGRAAGSEAGGKRSWTDWLRPWKWRRSRIASGSGDAERGGS